MLDSTRTRSSGGIALWYCPMLERAPRTHAMADRKVRNNGASPWLHSTHHPISMAREKQVFCKRWWLREQGAHQQTYHSRSKGSKFNLPDPLAISSPICILMAPISSRNRIYVGENKQIKSSNIHKTAFIPTPPEAIHSNVQTSTFLSVNCW